MFSRASFLGRRANGMVRQPVRTMATEQQLRARINSVKNTQKITAAMKMVAASKLRGAQEILAITRELEKPMDGLKLEPKEAKEPKSQLFLAMSSDKGLCGGINSSICRAARDSILAAQDKGIETSLMTIGEKGKQGLERQFGKIATVSITETSKFRAGTFKQAGELVDIWLAHGADKTSVFFQRFKSMIAYETTEDFFYSFDSYKGDLATTFGEYEIEGDPDTMQNLAEFRAAVKLFSYFAEFETSTLSARMSAMDNSSNNAKDMIDALSIVLNRNRQAKITTELSEIIGGAAAVDEV